MSSCATLLRQAVVKHDPQRHGLMLPPNPRAKYRDIASAPTEEQLRQHLAGTITLAAPATANDLAACIVLDVDAEAMTRVPLLMEAANEQNLWSWGEIHEERNRGYVHIPFAQLGNAAQLKAVGDTLITAADLSHIPADQLDNRTMNQAITRLPFGVHTWTGQRGLLVFPDGISYDLNQTLETGLAAWCERYTENAIPAAVTTLREALQTAPAPRRATKRAYYDYTYSPAVVQQMYNERYDVCTILTNHHARRGSRNSWHCPCGNHQHGDHHASLHIKAARNPKYGQYIVQGFSPACRFFSDPTRTYDAFNVYAALNGLSNAEMLKHARRELGLTTDRPDYTPERTADTTSHHQHLDRVSTCDAHHTPQHTNHRLTTIDSISIRETAMIALSTSPCSKGKRRIFTYICTTARQGLTCVHSNAQIALATDLSERQTRRVLRELEIQGFITITPRTGQTNIYQISDMRNRNAQETQEPVSAAQSTARTDDQPAHHPADHHTVGRGQIIWCHPELLHDRPDCGTHESASLKYQPLSNETLPRSRHIASPRVAPGQSNDLGIDRVDDAPGGGHLAPTIENIHVLSLNPVKPCKGGGIAPAPATPPAAAPAPHRDTPPFHALPVSEATDSDWQEGEDPLTGTTWCGYADGARFYPAGDMNADRGQGAQPPAVWTYSRSPRAVMHGHEYGMAELLRSQAERAAERQAVQGETAPEPTESPAPRLSQSFLTLPAPTHAPAEPSVAGLQGLRAELTRIEREARRYFAQKATNAGKQAQMRAAAVRRELAALENIPSARPAGAAKKTPGRRKTPPPYMLSLEALSGDFGAVAVCDFHPAVTELECESTAGSGLGKPIDGERLAEKLLGVGGTKGVHAEARSGANSGGIAGSGDLALRDAGEIAGVGEHVVAVTGDAGQDRRIEQAGDDALATALGVAADNLDCFIFKINVLNPQPSQLVDAEAAAEGQPCGQLDFAHAHALAGQAGVRRL